MLRPELSTTIASSCDTSVTGTRSADASAALIIHYPTGGLLLIQSKTTAIQISHRKRSTNPTSSAESVRPTGSTKSGSSLLR